MGCRRKLATISYLTPIGWLFSYIIYSKMNHSSLVSFHLKQSCGLNIISILINGIDLIFFNYKHPIEITYLYILFLVYMIIGIDYSTKGTTKPLPVFGQLLNRKLNFIK